MCVCVCVFSRGSPRARWSLIYRGALECCERDKTRAANFKKLIAGGSALTNTQMDDCIQRAHQRGKEVRRLIDETILNVCR